MCSLTVFFFNLPVKKKQVLTCLTDTHVHHTESSTCCRSSRPTQNVSCVAVRRPRIKPDTNELFSQFFFCFFLARANAQCRRKAAGGMQVVAKPHQRAHTTQQEACLLCVSITSDCILKLKHQKRFTSCLKIHINSVSCFGFY